MNLLALVVALAAALSAIAVLIRLAPRLELVARADSLAKPGDRTPCVGGIGVAVGLLAGSLCMAEQLSRALLFGALTQLMVGVVDDARALSARRKLAWQTVAACGAMAFERVESPLGNVPLALGVVWIVVVINAMNVTDVADALVGGIAIVTLAGVALLAPAQTPIALLMISALSGFLVFNAPPAKAYLGDGGCHFVGFVIAYLTFHAWQEEPSLRRAACDVILVGVPLLETCFISVMRFKRGAPWWLGSSDHFALRLAAAGFSSWETASSAWLAGLVCCVCALLLDSVGPWGRATTLLGLAVAAALTWRWLVGLGQANGTLDVRQRV